MIAMDRPTTEQLLDNAKQLRLVLTEASTKLSVFTQLLRDILTELGDEEEPPDE